MRISFPGAKAWLTMLAVLAAYFVAISIAPSIRLPSQINVSIVATGKKSPASQGSEVWIIRGPGLDLTVPHTGWEPRENGTVVSYQNQPTRVTWVTRVGSTQPLVFFKHPWSGLVEVSVGSQTKSIDLYSPAQDEVSIKIADILAEANWVQRLVPLGIFLISIAALTLALASTVREPPSRSIFKASFLVYFSAILAAHQLLENRTQIGALGSALTFLWFALVLGFQLIIIRCVVKLVACTNLRRECGWIESILITLAFSINTYCTFLFALNDGSLAFYLLLIAGSLLFFTAVFCSAYQPVCRACYTFCAVLAFSIVAKALYETPSYRVDSIQEQGQTATANVSDMPRSSVPKPNIYFLSLDGVNSRTAARKLFGAGDFDLWNILERSSFRLRDAKSPGQYTLDTFYRIFTLRPTAENANFDFLLGLDDNPIIERLKRANYRVQSIQGSNYLIQGSSSFGIQNGFWDHFSPASRAAFDYCWSVPSRLFFFGVCQLPKPRSLLYDSPPRHLSRVEARIPATISTGLPWFTFAHVLAPGHTALSFNFADNRARKQFFEHYTTLLNQLSEPLASLISAIKTHDPTSIVIFHSDHGPWLTRAWSKQSDRAGLYDETTVAMDRTSVFLAVYPGDFCSDKLNAAKTTADVLPSVFECLGF